MKSVSAFSVLAIALMLLSGTSLSEQVDPGIVIDWEEQTSAEAVPDQGDKFRMICCVDDLTGICAFSTLPGSCPALTREIPCPCPPDSEQLAAGAGE